MLYGHLPQVIGVVGAGQMGSGIAQVCASKGLDVLINDRSQELLERSMQSIRKSMQRLVQKGQLSKQNADEALGRVRTETSVDVSECSCYCCLGGWSGLNTSQSLFCTQDTTAYNIMISNMLIVCVCRGCAMLTL